jgi:hypothetical protein
MPDELDAFELDRFWNDLVRGQRPAGLNLPPELTDAVSAFQSLAAAPLPAGFGSTTDRVVEQAMASPAHHQTYEMEPRMNGFAQTSITRAPRPLAGPGWPPAPSDPRRWGRSSARFRLIAALVLLAGLFGAGAALFRDQTDHAAFIPAAPAIATIAPAGIFTQGTPASQPGATGVCPVSLPGPEVYNVGNYGNDALATYLYPEGVIVFTSQNGTPANGPYGTKFEWFRLIPGDLTITGRRLDAHAPPLTAEIPPRVGNHGPIPAVGITFRTVGCWEVTGHIAGKSLTFVTIVVYVPLPATPNHPEAASPTP